MYAIGESQLFSALNPPYGLEGADHLVCGHRTTSANEPPRHGTAYNALFCDGHVSAVQIAAFFDPGKTGASWINDHQPHPESW
jgi:prepilin-type processing-associated H-X9-DG protein